MTRTEIEAGEGAATPGYRHTQKGPWAWLLFGFGVLLLALGWALREMPVVPVVISISGAIMLLLGASFQRLTVSDEGDRLAVRFGPLPLFGMRIRYSDMRSVEVSRTTLLDGWGIHLSLRGGWVWNISGWYCVLIDHGGKTWLGTDDAENLARFLRSKIAAQGRG
jgi:hypothetical protein